MTCNTIFYSNTLDVLGVAFGEMDISPLTVFILGALTVFTFLAVGLSSMNLVKSAVEDEKEE